MQEIIIGQGAVDIERLKNSREKYERFYYLPPFFPFPNAGIGAGR